MYSLLKEKRSSILESLKDDYREKRMETYLTEIEAFLRELKHNLADVGKWGSHERHSDKPLMFFEVPYVHDTAFGVCLILDAWISPVSLAISAAIGAVAAGNAVVLLTNLSSVASALVKPLVRLLDPDTFLLIDQLSTTPSEVLKAKFDHIYFTGSGPVAQLVLAAAEDTSTPFTLEQCGKSVAVIDRSADIERTVSRLHAQGINGQKPDHILCPEEMYEKFIEFLKAAYVDSYGIPFVDFGRPQYRNRLEGLLRNVCIAVRGSFEPEKDDRVSRNTGGSMMREQFCGMRPLLKVKDMTDAIEYINSRDKPLTAFLFARDIEVIEHFVNGTAVESVSRIIVWD